MKRQRFVGVSGFQAAAEMATATSAKKKKPNQKAAVRSEEEQQQKNKKVAVGGGGGEENGRGLANNNWDDIKYYWPWVGEFVDEQMSWGSVWFPFWGLDFSGDAFGALYGDVVWNDDLWNLKNQIPNP